MTLMHSPGTLPEHAEQLWGDSPEDPAWQNYDRIEWSEWMSWITQASDDTRSAIIGEFIRENGDQVRILAAKITNHYRLNRTAYGDDVEQIVQIALYELFNDIAAGSVEPDNVHGFMGLWTYRARSAIRRWMDSPEMNAASGQVSFKRRCKEMRQTEQELLLNGNSSPTASEVVEATNERMKATRRDYLRQGMHCTLEDYHLMIAGPAVELDVDIHAGPSRETDSALHSSEREKMVRVTIQRCYAMGELHGKVAEMFFGPSLGADFDRPPLSSDVAEAFGIAPQTARRKLAEVRAVAQEVLYQYGIAGA